MFKPFAQADTSIKRKHQGLGIGLTIARHIVEQMGGKITAKIANTEVQSFKLTYL